MADWLEVPNLHSLSQEKVNRRVVSWFVKDSEPVGPYTFLEAYGLLSRFYRLLILGVIIYAVYSVLEGIGLPNLGLVVAAVLTMTTFGVSTLGSIRKISRLEKRRLRGGRFAAVTLSIVAIIVLIANIPVRTKIYADGKVSLRDDGIIYAPGDGQITWSQSIGCSVLEHQPIASIKDSKLEWSILRQEQRVAELRLAKKNQKLLRSQGYDNAAEVELKAVALESALTILRQFESQQKGLQVLAPTEGTLRPLARQVTLKQVPLDLKRRTSTLSNKNRKSFVESGEPLAMISSPDQQVVVLQVDEKQIEHVAIDQKVKLIIGQNSPDVVQGIVEAISIGKGEELDLSNSNSGSQQETISVYVRLYAPLLDAYFQSDVKAVVIGQTLPLYRRLWQILLENFDWRVG